MVGLGLHRRMLPHERARLSDWNPVEHDPDDCVQTRSFDGIPGAVFRPITRHDRAIGLGVVELHQYAGVSGGHKAVSVGCGSRATIQALHHRDRVTAPGVQVGHVAENPFRAAVDALGAAAGCTHALVYIPARNEWGFGEPAALIEMATKRLSPWQLVDRPSRVAVLRVPDAKATSLYQASRAATYLALSPHPPLEHGATLRLHARLSEGLGSEAGFRTALHTHTPPWSALLRGAPPTGPGAQRAIMLALLAERFRLELWGVDDPEPFHAVHIPAFRGPPPTEPDHLVVSNPFHVLPQLSPLAR